MIRDVTLVFDIGKTNKKLFLLDGDFNELHQEYIRFEEIDDDDGYPCDDLNKIRTWVLDSIKKWVHSFDYVIRYINFSTYGASLVHLDQSGKVICPFYNYLKPFPEDLEKDFFRKYFGEEEFSLATSSPSMGFLNSGLQLYYLKYRKSHLFNDIAVSLHFPQYLSYLITGQYWSDYTSIGCHTGIWDFGRRKYAEWISREGFAEKLGPIKSTSSTIKTTFENHELEVGIGVHDSSSALVPYIASNKSPFALISTGTWSICMCPFNNHQLTKDELEKDCLQFLTKDGLPVKASRLFLGQELRDKAMMIGEYFNVSYHDYKTVSFNPSFQPMKSDKNGFMYGYDHIDVERFGFENGKNENLSLFDDFEHAHHQLMHELTELQIASLKLALGSSDVNKIYIDGGFAHNELFTKMLAHKLPDKSIQSTDFALGSSLGAALLVRGHDLSHDGYFDNYQMRVHS